MWFNKLKTIRLWIKNAVLTLFRRQRTFVLATLPGLAFSPDWLRLLHYKKTAGGGYESFADGPAFFFSPQGKTNPQRELEATLEAFQKGAPLVGPHKFSPQCAFPARAGLILSRFPGSFPPVSCPDFQEWKSGIAAKGVSLNFSTSYANNPASMFGHTFLRFHSQSGGPSPADFLDYAATYSADTGSSGLSAQGMFYAIFGLFGHFKGVFSLSPYYLKLKEYNHQESRDIWEYQLNLAPRQVERMVEHLWELYATTYFDYYFLDENCSFHLLGLLEAANPEWDLTSQFQFFAAPNETIKKLKEHSGSLSKVSFRPSLRKILYAKWNRLNSSSRKEFFAALSGKKDIAQIQDPRLLDGLVTYLNFLKQEKAGNFPVEKEALLRKSLLASSQLEGAVDPTDSPPPSYPQDNQPDIGHEPSLLGVGMGSSDKSALTQFRFRLGFHDLLNSSQGYEPYHEIKVLDGEVQYVWKEKKFRLEDLAVISLKSLYPWHILDPQISWGLGLNIIPLWDYPGHALAFRAAAGLSKDILPLKMVVYSLFFLEPQLAGRLPSNFRIMPGLETSVLFHPLQPIKLQVTHEWTRPNNLWKLEATQNVAQSWEIGQEVLKVSGSKIWQGKLMINYFF